MSAPLRILHVIGGLNRGGIETWLLQVLRTIDRDRFRMDFLVHTEAGCPYDAEARQLGAKIIACPHPSRPWEYARRFSRILAENGPYDIVHSHVHHFNGFVLRLAAQNGVARRIAHSHNDTSAAEREAGWMRRGYLGLTRHWIRKHATEGFACSKPAAASLFGDYWERDGRWRTLPYSIDLGPFTGPGRRPDELRRELGIAKPAFVVGHVGRFVPQKNHRFLIDVAEQVCRRVPESIFLLVGDGPLRGETEAAAAARGLGGRVLFAGNRPDVAGLMTSVMDLMVLPSLHEGLGLVLVEAQAAGLPSLFSDRVPDEAVVIAPLMHRLSLTEPAARWADALIRLRSSCPPLSQPEALRQMAASPYNIKESIHELEHAYLA